MFKSHYLWAFLTIVFIFLDIIMKGVKIFGTHSDITFLLVVFAGLNHGFLYGSAIGFAGGLAKDIFLSASLGPGAFALTLTGFLAGLFGKRVFYQNIFIQVLIIFIATLFKWFLTNILLLIIHLSPYPGRDIVSQAFFNAFLTPPLYLLLGIIARDKSKV